MATAVILMAGIYTLTTYRFAADNVPAWLTIFPSGHELRVAVATLIERGLDYLTTNGQHLFKSATATINSLLGIMEAFLAKTPWPVTMTVIASIAYLRGRLPAAILTVVALAYLSSMGLWEKAMETVSLLGTAALISILIGGPVGVLCAKSQQAYRVVRPVLGLMQTMPAFVYLVPAIAFFGIGKPPGILATIIFSVAPMVHLTVLGIRGVPETVKEAAVAFGASKSFLLFNVELPLALPSIMTGINQTTMMCLSMTVAAALIGAKGLGEDVLEALGRVAAGQGIVAGVAIIFCALVLDRIMQGNKQTFIRR
jgi:glycine betaine/proline transport system permease protein